MAITAENHLGTDNHGEASLTEAYTQRYSVPADAAASWRMTPTYQNALSREVEALFGTVNHDMVTTLHPSVCSMIVDMTGG